MKNYINKLPADVQNLIYLAQDAASMTRVSAYLVGGCVRDLILGAKNLDLDIVVEGDGIKFAESLAGRLKARLIRHRRFGTATVILGAGSKIDVATARREYYIRPASLPSVIRGTIKDDLKRRDFTINAMAINITGEDFGKPIDFFDGKKDLNNKKIRVLHDLSFIDDPTRILRAVRFEKRYNFKIEPKALRLLKEAVKIKMLNRVQPQRLRDELILMLKEKYPIKHIKRIQELAGFSFINPNLFVSRKSYRLLQSIEDQVNWFRKIYPLRRKLDVWLIYFMGLIDFLNITAVRSICRRYVFSKGEQKRLLGYKKINSKFIRGLSQSEIKPAKIFGLLEPLSYEVILAIKAKYKNLRIQRRIKDFFEIYNGMRIHIHGDDLRRLGVTPGPYYKKIFTQVLNAKLNGKVTTKEEELILIKKLIKVR